MGFLLTVAIIFECSEPTSREFEFEPHKSQTFTYQHGLWSVSRGISIKNDGVLETVSFDESKPKGIFSEK